MKEIKFIVNYDGENYGFNYGSEVYIFHTVVYNNVSDIELILKIVDTIHAVYLKDENRTPLGALADYVAENWDELKELSRSEILERFYFYNC